MRWKRLNSLVKTIERVDTSDLPNMYMLLVPFYHICHHSFLLSWNICWWINLPPPQTVLCMSVVTCVLLILKHSLAHCLLFISGYSLPCVWWRTVKCDYPSNNEKEVYWQQRVWLVNLRNIWEQLFITPFYFSYRWRNCHKTFGDNRFFIIPKKPKRVNIN